MKPTITIIGAGISGLTAAVYLHNNGFHITILEASERAGGRIKTDVINGFHLDRGFQVLLTAYPEVQKLIDYKALNLQKFSPGAFVLYDGGTFTIADPFRKPSDLLATIFAPAGSLVDKLNTFLLKNKLITKSIETIFNQDQKTTADVLTDYGFSPKMINRFYQPFMSGIFLENELKTSRRMFDFVMKMFSEGDVAIPALGMEEIPKQLVAMLPKNTIQYITEVSKIENNIIYCTDSKQLASDIVIVATEATSLISNYIPTEKQNYNSVTNLYFETNIVPNSKKVVILNASSTKKWVNNLAIMTNISTQYAPIGKCLISVSYNGIDQLSDEILSKYIQNELQPWFGNAVFDWKFLKSYKIKYALPNQNSVQNNIQLSNLKLSKNLYYCGDFLLNGSINAAMKSGNLVAEAIIQDYK